MKPGLSVSDASALNFFQAKHNFYSRTHLVDECKNEYAAQLQNFNAEQWKHFNNAIPHIFKVSHTDAAAGWLILQSY